jgi:CRP/FNR family cyclic AMP-dependent transcriptional regulator
LAVNATKRKLAPDAGATVTRKRSGGSVKRRRRTKGPSEKMRSLAALSLAPKVGYLQVSDLTGSDEKGIESLVDKRLPKRNYKKGEQIYPTARKEPVLFMVKRGSVNIFRPSTQGGQYAIKRLESGSIFGEMPLIGQSMLGAHAEAGEATEIILISAQDFDRIASSSPDIALNAMRKLGPRLVEAERQHERAAFHPVTARIASLLVRLANEANQVIGYTHQEMADLLGVYRETVTNAIAELKQDRLVQVGRKRITLLNPDALLKLETL